MTVRIFVGDFGSGKTTSAKRKGRERNAHYIDVEKYLGYTNYDVDGLVRRLKSEIKTGHDYYLDGIWGRMADANYMSRELGTVEYVLCMASPSVLQERQRRKAKHVLTNLPRSLDGIKSVWNMHYDIVSNGHTASFCIDTTNGKTVELSSDNMVNAWEGLLLYDELKGVRPYQDIVLKLPGEKWGYNITGYTQSYKTWQRLKKIGYVFGHGKAIVDFGCHYGYFLFRIEELGVDASLLMGIDSNQKALEVGETIARISGSQAIFMCRNLQDGDVFNGDVALALNVLHHLKYDETFLNNLFRSFQAVVLENDISALPLLNGIAERYSHKVSEFIKSHRAGRAIIVYERKRK